MAGIKIKGRNIVHTRGDTAILRLTLEIEGHPFVLREGDSAIFSVKKNLKDKEYVLQKELDGQNVVFRHSDTQDLPYGNYWYDIQVKLKEGQVVTAVGPAQYQLTADVTGS